MKNLEAAIKKDIDKYIKLDLYCNVEVDDNIFFALRHNRNYYIYSKENGIIISNKNFGPLGVCRNIDKITPLAYKVLKQLYHKNKNK